MNKQRFKNISFIFTDALATLLFMAACTLQSTPGNPAGQPNNVVEKIVQQTFAAFTQAAANPNATPDEYARQTDMAQAVAQTVAAMLSNTPEFAPTPTLTPTSGTVQVTVSLETNCRAGPGPAYEKLGILKPGQTAEVAGRNSINDTWIIKLPSNPAVTCWLWGQYATVTGNWGSLPIIKTPPTPTPGGSFVVDYSNTQACTSQADWWLNFKITNTGNGTWKSVSVKITDLTTGEFRQAAFNDFRRYSACGIIDLAENLGPGATGYAGYSLTHNPAGHTVTATFQVCSSPDLMGACRENTINFAP